MTAVKGNTVKVKDVPKKKNVLNTSFLIPTIFISLLIYKLNFLSTFDDYIGTISNPKLAIFITVMIAIPFYLLYSYTSIAELSHTERDSEETHSQKKWREIFHIIRHCTSIPVTVVHFLFAVMVFWINISGTRRPLQQNWDENTFLRSVLLTGTIGELGVTLGFMFFMTEGRIMPFWTIQHFQYLSDFLFQNRLFHNFIISIFCFMLVMSTAVPTICSNLFHIVLACLYILLCCIDLWRLFYTHYFLIMIISLCYDQATAHSILRILLSSLYFWSGFYKMVHPSFYSSTADWVFSPIHDVVKFIIEHLTCCCDGLAKAATRKILDVVSFLGVFSECLMGMILALPLLIDGIVENYAGLFYFVCFFNLFMHTFIIVYLGLGQKICVFLPWNACVCLLVQILYSPILLQSEASSKSLLLFNQEQTIVISLAIVALFIYPMTLLFGAASDLCLCHAYFAPGYTGDGILLIPKDVAMKKLPMSANGIPLYSATDSSKEHACNIVVSKAEIKAKGDKEEDEDEDKDENDWSNWSDYDKMIDSMIALDGSIVDLEFCNGLDDRWKTNYGANNVHFFAVLVRQLKLDTNCIFVLSYHFSILRWWMTGTFYGDLVWRITKDGEIHSLITNSSNKKIK
jgi:hypothetical protein